MREEFARNNLVWVISVNENIMSEDLLENYWKRIRGDTINNDSIIEPDPTDTLEYREDRCKEYFISDLYLKRSLEGWWGGKSDVWVIGAFMNEYGWQVFYPTHFRMLEVWDGNLYKWLHLKEQEGVITVSKLQSDDSRTLCKGELLDFIIYERDPYKKKRRREFIPWMGDDQSHSNETYEYYSKEDDFFCRSYPYCGRWYSELPNFYNWTDDKTFNHPYYAGECKGKAAFDQY